MNGSPLILRGVHASWVSSPWTNRDAYGVSWPITGKQSDLIARHHVSGYNGVFDINGGFRCSRLISDCNSRRCGDIRKGVTGLPRHIVNPLNPRYIKAFLERFVELPSILSRPFLPDSESTHFTSLIGGEIG